MIRERGAVLGGGSILEFVQQRVKVMNVVGRGLQFKNNSNAQTATNAAWGKIQDSMEEMELGAMSGAVPWSPAACLTSEGVNGRTSHANRP